MNPTFFNSSSEAKDLVVEAWKTAVDNEGWDLVEPDEPPSMRAFITDLTGQRLVRGRGSARDFKVASGQAEFHSVVADDEVCLLGDDPYWRVRMGGHEEGEIVMPNGQKILADLGMHGVLSSLFNEGIETAYSCEGGVQVESMTLPYWWRAVNVSTGRSLAYPFPLWERDPYLTVTTPKDFVRAKKILESQVELTSLELSRLTFRWQWL